MKNRTIPKTKDQISPLGFGAMRLTTKNGRIDKEKGKKEIYYSIDHGINLIDTAFLYHNGANEEFLGEILQGEYREKVKISTKMPHWYINEKEQLEKYLNKQLKKLQTTYIDYYSLHGLDLKNLKRLEKINIYQFLEEKQKEGKIKNIGFSSHEKAENVNKIIDAYDWDFCILQYNYYDEGAQASEETIQHTHEKGMGIFIMEPLKGGLLAGKMPEKAEQLLKETAPNKSNAEWAFQWLLNQKEITCVLSGMNDLNQIKENIEICNNATTNPLSQEEQETLNEAKNILKDLMKINCTSCRYCMPCPKGVDIPGIFSLYNSKYILNQKQTGIEYMWRHMGVQGEPTAASLCTECGKCSKACPQHLDIAAELKVAQKDLGGRGAKYKLKLIQTLIKPLGSLATKIMSR